MLNSKIFVIVVFSICYIQALDLKVLPEYFMEMGVSGHCGKTVQSTNAYVRSHAAIKLGSGIIPYSNNENCTISYKASAGSLLLVSFTKFQLEDNSCNDSLSLIENGAVLRTFCDKQDNATTFESDGSSIEFRFITDEAVQNIGFTALVTAYRNDSNCTANEFQCDANRCIDASLKCNGVANCLDGSDETKEKAECTTLDKILGKIRSLGKQGVLAIIILLSCIVFICFSGTMLYQGFVKEPMEGPTKL